MKNKFYIIIAMFFLSILPASANAEENGVYAKNTNKTVGNVITSKLNSGKATFKLDDYNVNITSTNKNDNNDIIVIKSQDNSLNWVKKQLNSYDVTSAYYITFYKNGAKTMPSGKVTIYFNKSVGKKIISLDLKGNIINVSESYINIETNDQYIALSKYIQSTNKEENNTQNPQETKQAENLVYIDCDQNGMIANDGIKYNGISQIKATDDKLKLAIIPNKGYIVDSVYINNINATPNLKSGFIIVNKGDSVKVTFKKYDKKDNSNNLYTIKGKLTQNNVPLKNVKLVLQNNNIIATTDNEGNYIFKNISSGYQTLLIYNGENLIGYKEFYIENGKETEVKNQNTLKINTNDKNISLNMNINDYEVFFAQIEKPHTTTGTIITNQKNNVNDQGTLVIKITLIIVLIITIITIILLLRRNRKKANPVIESFTRGKNIEILSL